MWVLAVAVSLLVSRTYAGDCGFVFRDQIESHGAQPLLFDPSLDPVERLILTYQEEKRQQADPDRLLRLLAAIEGRQKQVAWIHTERGFIHLKRGDIDRAFLSFVAAFGLQPTSALNAMNMLSTALNARDLKKAAIAADEAIKWFPEDRRIVGRAVQIYLKAGRLEKALTYSQQLVDQEAENVIGLLLLAKTLISAERYESAFTVIDQLEAIEGASPEVLWLRSRAHFGLRDFDQAPNAVERRLQREGPDG